MESVLITGSSRGLGKQLALVFGSAGYKVIIHGREETEINKTRDELEKLNINYDLVLGDLTKGSTMLSLERAAIDNKISVLINNAAVLCSGLAFEELSEMQQDEILQTNLIAPIKLTGRIYKLFLQKGKGSIINISSLSALEPQKKRTLYSASKWGLRGFTDVLRLEAEERGITVIGVYASRIKTRPEHSYGIEAEYVAKKIYEHFASGKKDNLILDERPPEFRRKI
ncbi:MAG: SDR family NAD(P)-dependent oxidoreductase [Nanoarchaeota archaeon]